MVVNNKINEFLAGIFSWCNSYRSVVNYLGKKNKIYKLFSGFSEVKMSLKPTFRPVLLVFFRFCCDVQPCNRTRRIVIITRRVNDVKMRGKCWPIKYFYVL